MGGLVLNWKPNIIIGARGASLLSLLSSSLPHRVRYAPTIHSFFSVALIGHSSLFSPPSFSSVCPCITNVMTFQSLPPPKDKALPAQCAEQRPSHVQNVALHPHPSSIRIPHYNYLPPPLLNHHRSVLTHGSSSPASSRFGHPRPF